MATFENHFEAGSICNQIQGDQINYYAIDKAYFTNQHGEAVATPAATEKAATGAAKKQGKLASALFQKDGNRTVEDVARREQESTRLKGYISRHHLGGRMLTSQADDMLNRVIVCFCYMWRQKKWVSAEVGAPALRRFLTEDCEIGLSVSEKSFEGVIRKMIGEEYDAEVFGGVKECFINND